MSSPYPTVIPLESGDGRPIRKLYSNLTKSLNNPQLPLSKDGPLVAAPVQGGANTKASAVSSDLSTQSLQALAITDSGFPMRGHSTSAATGRPVHADGSSVSSSGSSCLLDDKSAYGTFNDVHVAHEVAHMATWVDDSLGGLETTPRQLLSSSMVVHPQPTGTHTSLKLSQGTRKMARLQVSALLAFSALSERESRDMVTTPPQRKAKREKKRTTMTAKHNGHDQKKEKKKTNQANVSETSAQCFPRLHLPFPTPSFLLVLTFGYASPRSSSVSFVQCG